MKTPYEEIIAYFRENLDVAIENDKSAQNFLDSFTIWLLGFSVGSIALLIGNIEDVTKYYSYWVVKSIIVLLVLSIIAGVLHRMLLFNLKTKYNQTLFYVRGALSDKNIMQTEIVDISQIVDIEELVERLKLDFDLDHTKELEIYRTLEDDKRKEILFTSLVNHYQRTNQWAKTSFDNGMNYIMELMNNVYLYKGKDYKGIMNSKHPNLKRLDIIQTLCLYFSCLCFILAAIILMIWY